MSSRLMGEGKLIQGKKESKIRGEIKLGKKIIQNLGG